MAFSSKESVMRKGFSRRHFLGGLLAAWFGPWLGRARPAPALPSPPQPPVSSPPAFLPLNAGSPVTTVTYDPGRLHLWLPEANCITTISYDRSGRMLG
jgi:hypothetical protein